MHPGDLQPGEPPPPAVQGRCEDTKQGAGTGTPRCCLPRDRQPHRSSVLLLAGL